MVGRERDDIAPTITIRQRKVLSCGPGTLHFSSSKQIMAPSSNLRLNHCRLCPRQRGGSRDGAKGRGSQPGSFTNAILSIEDLNGVVRNIDQKRLLVDAHIFESKPEEWEPLEIR